MIHTRRTLPMGALLSIIGAGAASAMAFAPPTPPKESVAQLRLHPYRRLFQGSGENPPELKKLTRQARRAQARQEL